MNKRGFTLIELLTTIGILSLIMGIGMIAYTAIVNNSKIRVFKTYESTMHAEAMSLMMEALSNPSKGNYYPSLTEPKTLRLSDLQIEPIKNPVNKDDLCPDSYVRVARSVHDGVDSFTYTVCLICRNSDYNASASASDESLCEVYEN